MTPLCDVCGDVAIQAVLETHEYAENGWLLSLPGKMRCGCAVHPIPIMIATRHASKDEAMAAMIAATEAAA